MDIASAIEEVRCYGFQQDKKYFICGMGDGFRIFSYDTLKERHRQSLDGGVLHVEVLFPYVVFIGDGKNPKYPSNAVAIYDYRKEKCIDYVHKFDSDVKGIRLKRDRLVVVLESAIQVYDCTSFSSPKLKYKDFTSNPNGVCAICSHNDNFLMAYPSARTGQVILVKLAIPVKDREILAHYSSLACMAFNNDGTRLATASERGTLIRIFDTKSYEKINELRRGSTTANISCINFSEDSKMLCVTSDHGTIHVFYVEAKDNDKNMQTSLYLAGYFSNYFNSMWSFCQLQIPGTSPSFCAFRENKIIALCTDGSYYKFSFTPEGKSELEVSSKFLTLREKQNKTNDESHWLGMIKTQKNLDKRKEKIDKNQEERTGRIPIRALNHCETNQNEERTPELKEEREISGISSR